MILQPISPVSDLNSIFKQNPKHVNNEYVYPAKVDKIPIYIHPECEGNNEIKEFLENHLVTILAPNTLESIKDHTIKKAIRILQSCYENGRVLEASQKILIDDIEHSIMLKGIGSTAYARETGAINPWMRGDIYKHTNEEKQALENFSFYQCSGLYGKEKALIELERSQILNDMGIDSEKVLAIYELKEVLGENGDYVSIKELEKNNTITKGKRPVILIRAHKTNFRLLDIIMLDKYDRKDSIAPLVEHILNESEKHWGTSNIDEYIQRFFTTVVKNRLSLIGSFSRLNGEFWQDICRNISMFGEELDLGTMDPITDNYHIKNPHSYLDRYKRNMHSIFIGFSQMVNTIEENTNYKINHEELADQVYKTLIQWVKDNEEEITELYYKGNWQKWFGHQNLDSYLITLVKALFSFFINWSNTCEYENILKEKIQEKLES